MNKLLANLKKELARDFPQGATLEQVRGFCKKHPLLKEDGKILNDFIEYVGYSGE